MPEKERANDDTKEITNELNKIIAMLCLTKFAPACAPASYPSWAFEVPAPAIAPFIAPPTMHMAKYTTTKKKTNNTIEVAMRFSSNINLNVILWPILFHEFEAAPDAKYCPAHFFDGYDR
jgi:hypothetical protein